MGTDGDVYLVGAAILSGWSMPTLQGGTETGEAYSILGDAWLTVIVREGM